MTLYSLLKLIHGGVLHKDQRYLNLLLQNKFYIIPTVNVDGLTYIEQHYRSTGEVVAKRKNMHFPKGSEKCNKTTGGVDLNRNYGFSFGKGAKSK